MRGILAGIAAALVAAPIMAAETYTVDPRHTYTMFEVSHQGFTMQFGRFNRTEGRIVLDREAGSGSVDIRIDAASIDMGLDEWDEEMRSENYFNVEKFPQITFKSDSLRFEGDRLTAVDGTLTLLGVSRPVRLRVTHFRCARSTVTQKFVCGANAETAIRRSDFGMKRGLPFTGDDVTIRIAVEAIRD